MLVQEIDKKKNPFKGTMYYGNGLTRSPKVFIESDTDDDEYMGGFIDLGSLLSKISNVVSENKDTIQAVAGAASKVAEFGKATADAVKSGQELKKTEEARKKAKKSFTSEQEKHLMTKVGVGEGFARFKKS